MKNKTIKLIEKEIKKAEYRIKVKERRHGIFRNNGVNETLRNLEEIRDILELVFGRD